MTELPNIDEELKKELSALPKDFWDFKRADTKELTHSIHNYPAVMIYPISRNIINIVKKYRDIDVLFDPFMGSGTVVLEGILAGIPKIYGNDLNPLAYRIAKAKTTILREGFECEINDMLAVVDENYAAYQKLLDEIDGYIANKGYDITVSVNDKNNWGNNAPQILEDFMIETGIKLEIPDIKNLGFWFVPKAIIELQLIRMAVCDISDTSIREYCELAFSETVRIVSNRRNGEFKMYRMPPEQVADYHPDVKAQFIRIITENISKMNKLRKRLQTNRSHWYLSQEDTTISNAMQDESVDLVITSPPYGDSRTTVAYGQFSRLSLQWCDYGKRTYKEIADIDKSLLGGNSFKKGFEMDIDSSVLRQSLTEILRDGNNLERAGDVYSFYKDLEQSMRAISGKCRRNGYQFWVVGNRTVKGVRLRTDEIIVELGERMGLQHVTTTGRSISNKVMPSVNSPTNRAGQRARTMEEELIVVLRKEG
ncbi:MAG: hypothetical protein K2L82_06765 [Lachnospiraceae bacterium]|nr:hypothetical protein [Lachnospiraceae bacterium]